MTLNERVISVVCKNMETKLEVKPESELINDLKMDSLGIIMLIAALEDELDIEISGSDFKNIRTVADIVNQLQAHFPGLESKTR
jgi:acyl carrier protein